MVLSELADLEIRESEEAIHSKTGQNTKKSWRLKETFCQSKPSENPAAIANVK